MSINSRAKEDVISLLISNILVNATLVGNNCDKIEWYRGEVNSLYEVNDLLLKILDDLGLKEDL